MNVTGCFVTGTDTGVGKTLVAAGIARAFRERGRRVAAMKPVASGCLVTSAGLRNEDALILQRECSTRWPYEIVNPFAYEPAVAPHLAAEEAGRPIDLAVIERCARQLAAGSDVLVVEGAGGWLVPLGGGLSLADLATRLALPVVLVVGLRLGCLNHAVLTQESIAARGLRLAGWVANAIDPAFERAEANLATLRAGLRAPLLGTIEHLRTPDVRVAAERLDVGPLG